MVTGISRLPERSSDNDVWAMSTIGSALLHALVVIPMVYFGTELMAHEDNLTPLARSAPKVVVAVRMSDFDPPKVVEPKPVVHKQVAPVPTPPKAKPVAQPKQSAKTAPARSKKTRKRRRVAKKAPAQRIMARSDKAATAPAPSSDLSKAGQEAVSDAPPPKTAAAAGTPVETVPAPAPVVVPTVDTTKLLKTYLRRVGRAVRKDFKYPRAAIRAGMEGRAVVSITIDAEGRVINAKLSRSSGYTILDQAAVEAARSIAKVPKAPEALEWSQRRVKIPFKFQLRS